MTPAVYLGIDVSKASLEVGTTQRRIGQFPNSADGLAQLRGALKGLPVERIIIEATGVYSTLAADTLSQDFTVVVVQPGRVRRFAQSQGILAKTDAIDVQVIARYGEASPQLRAYQPPSEQMRRLRALVDRRDQIIDDIKREKTRLEACRDPQIDKSIKRHIASMTKSAKAIEQAIKKLLAQDEQLTDTATTLEEHTGVGPVTATCLMAHLPELGRVNRQEIAALAGLAPYNRDSGAMSGKRAIYGGRKRVRTALYMAALAAIRADQTMKQHYHQLRARGKQAKVAIIACARKLIIRLNSAMARLIASGGPHSGPEAMPGEPCIQA